MKYPIILIFISVYAISCCKVKMDFQTINRVQFTGFIVSEIDTFYSLPKIKDSIIPYSKYNNFQETTTSLNAILKKNSLNTENNEMEIVLKDTSKRYAITNIRTTSTRLGKGRCAGSSTSIDSFKVNGINNTSQVILISK